MTPKGYFGTEAAAAKAVDLATKCNMISLHPTNRLGILKLYYDLNITN
jgi:hypothetical protein